MWSLTSKHPNSGIIWNICIKYLHMHIFWSHVRGQVLTKSSSMYCLHKHTANWKNCTTQTFSYFLSSSQIFAKYLIKKLDWRYLEKDTLQNCWTCYAKRFQFKCFKIITQNSSKCSQSSCGRFTTMLIKRLVKNDRNNLPQYTFSFEIRHSFCK